MATQCTAPASEVPAKSTITTSTNAQPQRQRPARDLGLLRMARLFRFVCEDFREDLSVRLTVQQLYSHVSDLCCRAVVLLWVVVRSGPGAGGWK